MDQKLKRKKHICVVHRYPISQAVATNPSFVLFLKKLLSNDYEVTFVSFKEPNSSFKINGINYIELGKEISRAKFSDKLIDSILFLLRIPFVIMRIKRRYNIDLVYCDDSFPFYGFLIKKITRLPTVIRLGDLQSAYMFEQRGIVGNLIFKVVFFFEKIMWLQVDKIIPISFAFKDFLIKHGIPEEKMAVVLESIDFEYFKKDFGKLSIRDKYCQNGGILIMFHGLISPIKGINILLEAVQKIIRELPKLRLIVVGSGEGVEKLKIMSKDLNIEKNVIFVGWVPLNQIADYINACDIGIPNRNNNLGNNFIITTALLQYWAMKKPVVMPRLQAIVETVRGTKLEEFMFEPDNPDDLSIKIRNLVNKKQIEKEYLAEEGYKLANNYFNIESVSQNMLNTLERYIYGKS